MATICVKHIGPIVDSGVIELKQFNVFIGKQSTGKSTLMKIICFCQWLEKHIMTGDDKKLIYNYTHYYRFLKELKQYHRMSDDFFSSHSQIVYRGEAITIDCVGNKNAKISRTPSFDTNRHNVKISFIPSERNLVSVFKNIDRTYRTKENDVIINHIFEWGEAKEHTSEKNTINLSVVGNMEYYYDSVKGMDWIKLTNEQRKISPFYASSGVQSVLPISVISNYLTSKDLYDNIPDFSKFEIVEFFRLVTSGSMDDASKAKLTESFAKKYKYRATKLFIEEPEQNLFPESQQKLVNFIVDKINSASLYTHSDSCLTLTTHSPYIITSLNVLLKAFEANQINSNATQNIVPLSCQIPIDKLQAYFICEDGTLKDIVDRELNMISGIELDQASERVEDSLCALNDIIYG